MNSLRSAGFALVDIKKNAYLGHFCSGVTCQIRELHQSFMEAHYRHRKKKTHPKFRVSSTSQEALWKYIISLWQRSWSRRRKASAVQQFHINTLTPFLQLSSHSKLKNLAPMCSLLQYIGNSLILLLPKCVCANCYWLTRKSHPSQRFLFGRANSKTLKIKFLGISKFQRLNFKLWISVFSTSFDNLSHCLYEEFLILESVCRQTHVFKLLVSTAIC